MQGVCPNCGEWGNLTMHHLFGVRDMMEMHPDLSHREAKNREYRFRKQGVTDGPKIPMCRDCHDVLEFRKAKKPEKVKVQSKVRVH